MLVPTAVAGALVVHDLGSRSLWLDEGFTFTAASQHGVALLHAALKDGGNALAYYIGMHYWISVFGSTERALRLPTAIAAIGTIPVCFHILRRLFDHAAAVSGSFCVAVSVSFVWWAQNARAYVVAVFFVCAAMLAFVVAVQSGRRLAWAAYVVLTVIGLYTVVLSVLVVVAQAISLLLRQGQDLQRRALLASAGAITVLALPLVWVFADHGAAPAQWAVAPGALLGKNDRYLFDFLASSRSVGVPFKSSIVGDLTLAAVLCWALGTWLFLRELVRRGRTENAWAYGLLFAWFVIPPLVTYVVTVAFQPVLSDRYILGSLPPASMIAGVALSRLRPWPVAVTAALALIVLRAWVIMPGYGVSLENWRQGVTDIAARSQPHDCIAFFVADGYNPFDYYVLHLTTRPGPVPTPVLPEATWQSRSPHALDPEAVPRARMAGVVSSCPRLWLVMSHGAGYPPGPGVLPYRVRVYHAGHTLMTELNGSYRETSAWWFRGAHVSLYVRRGSMAAASSSRLPTPSLR